MSCLVVVAFSLLAPGAWIEAVFSRGLFQLVQHGLVPLTGAVPFTLAGCLLVALPVLAIVWAVRGWRRAADTPVRARLVKGGGVALRGALYLYTAFLLIWGLGYRRTPIETRWKLDDRQATLQEVRDLQARLVALIHRDCVPDGERDRDRARRAIEAAQAALIEDLEGYRPAWPTYVKGPPTGALMALDVYGVISPWTLEAHVEPALPPPHWLAILGHELAHVAGYCGEADANLVGFVSGLRADDPFARYGTALRLLEYTATRKGLLDYHKALRSLPQRARDDINATRKVRSEHRVSGLAEVSTGVYDKYLRTQGMSDGVGDYSRGFRLLVSAWRRGLVQLPEPAKADAEPRASGR